MVTFVCFFVLVGVAAADYLEVRRPATLKASPDTGAAVRARPEVGDRLQLLDNGRQQNGYYHAEPRSGGPEGWIYRTLVRRHAGALPGDTPAADPETGHCPLECPLGAPTANDMVRREIYTLSSNPDTKFADWVAYRVTRDTIGPTRSRGWRADPMLNPARTLEPEDYTEAHAVLQSDRGHQAPLASFTSTPHWRDTNFLSNITPQKTGLNQGRWERLEAAERDLAREPSVEAVFVVTGPLYERDMPRLPRADEPHRVPSGYWKVVMIEPGDTIQVAAFIFDQNTPRTGTFCQHLITVDELERRSGLDLFSRLEDSRENQLESAQGALAARLGCGS
jgi:endonuclease G